MPSQMRLVIGLVKRTMSNALFNEARESALVEARHQFDEVARLMPVVELMGENSLPGVTAGAA
ncbi:hypothetical protein D3C86_2146270 [compost metagenome]